MPQATQPDPTYGLMRDWTQRWADLESDLAQLLLQPHEQAAFEPRLLDVQHQAQALLDLDPDASLYWLLQLASQSSIGYSISHALVCWALCRLVGPSLALQQAQQTSLECASLTMNLGMTALQNTLAEQANPPSTEQRERIETHAARSTQWLRELGVTNPAWLNLVEHHHEAPLASDTAARLLQAVDRYAAQISPRQSRAGLRVTDSGRHVVAGGNANGPDPVGQALLRTVGICPPGSFVRLEDDSTAVVLRRTAHPGEPWVARVLDAQRLALPEPQLVDTGRDGNGIAAALVGQNVRVRLNHARLLQLSRMALVAG